MRNPSALLLLPLLAGESASSLPAPAGPGVGQGPVPHSCFRAAAEGASGGVGGSPGPGPPSSVFNRLLDHRAWGDLRPRPPSGLRPWELLPGHWGPAGGASPPPEHHLHLWAAAATALLHRQPPPGEPGRDRAPGHCVRLRGWSGASTVPVGSPAPRQSSPGPGSPSRLSTSAPRPLPRLTRRNVPREVQLVLFPELLGAV